MKGRKIFGSTALSFGLSESEKRRLKALRAKRDSPKSGQVPYPTFSLFEFALAQTEDSKPRVCYSVSKRRSFLHLSREGAGQDSWLEDYLQRDEDLTLDWNLLMPDGDPLNSNVV